MTRIEDSANRLDHVIDDLLRGPSGPVLPEEEALAPTARLLHETLPRLHPRFGFEEHLAARLAAAARSGSADSSSAEPTPIGPRPAARSPAAAAHGDDGGTVDRRRRGLVAGGAIASGVSLAIPLAGAAYVAWRRSRSSGLL